VLPVFLHPAGTAMQTGMVILPGAIASAFTMAFVDDFVARRCASADRLGAFMFLGLMWMMSATLDSGQASCSAADHVVWGSASSCRHQRDRGRTAHDEDRAPLFNLMRQLGGSVGIAVMATLLRLTRSKAVLTDRGEPRPPHSSAWRC
jgi:DHA2 family multidrug resistance protein